MRIYLVLAGLCGLGMVFLIVAAYAICVVSKLSDEWEYVDEKESE